MFKKAGFGPLFFFELYCEREIIGQLGD